MPMYYGVRISTCLMCVAIFRSPRKPSGDETDERGYKHGSCGRTYDGEDQAACRVWIGSRRKGTTFTNESTASEFLLIFAYAAYDKTSPSNSIQVATRIYPRPYTCIQNPHLCHHCDSRVLRRRQPGSRSCQGTLGCIFQWEDGDPDSGTIRRA